MNEVSIIPVVQGEEVPKIEDTLLPEKLPILALRNAVLFPGIVYPVTVGREISLRVVQDVAKKGGFLGAVPQSDVTVENPREGDLCAYGTVAKVLRTLDMPDGSVTAILQGVKRLKIKNIVSFDPYIEAYVDYLTDELPEENDPDIRAISDSLKERAVEIVKSSSFAPKEAVAALKGIDNFPFLVNFIATTVEVEHFQGKTDLLAEAPSRPGR